MRWLAAVTAEHDGWVFLWWDSVATVNEGGEQGQCASPGGGWLLQGGEQGVKAPGCC